MVSLECRAMFNINYFIHSYNNDTKTHQREPMLSSTCNDTFHFAGVLLIVIRGWIMNLTL